MNNSRILFCASEAFPLIKTGGLADVAGSLPRALQHLGHDVRLVIPAYREVLAKVSRPAILQSQVEVMGYPVSILQTTLPGSRVPTWLVSCPELFDHAGNPYLDEHGNDRHDNAQRFGLFCQVVALLAMNECGMHWRPHLVHCNDWQTGLVPVYLAERDDRPATVFTIHNLAYQGLFGRTAFAALGLPETLWDYQRLEFHGQFSFLKGGLVYADRLTTVSPRYAEEIQTAAFGCGLDGLLRHRQDRLSGILNGIDTRIWNPGTDPFLAHRYNRRKLASKALNKRELQALFGLPASPGTLLIGMVARLTEQKGIDTVLNIVPALAELDLQLAIVGSGAEPFETGLLAAAGRYPDRIAVRIGHDEAAAHLVEAGADSFLMPSRFEPCGLNQMYSQRYGTLPIVTPVGGLADTVVDTDDATIANGTATGFVMERHDEASLIAAVLRAWRRFQDRSAWTRLMHNAMQQDFSWKRSAVEYSLLYAGIIGEQPADAHTGIQVQQPARRARVTRRTPGMVLAGTRRVAVGPRVRNTGCDNDEGTDAT